MMNPPVEILLSTYNGEKYLSVQLDSILQQDYPDWKLTIRDDGSNDSTLTIINKYIQKYPAKISQITDTEGNLGYSGSFTKLVRQSSADYIMLCDQDDYWQPSKISSMLSVMLEQEALLPATPHIVFADLQVADAELNVTSPSFLKLTGYSAHKGMQIFFLKNYVPGCNILCNRNLVKEAIKTENTILLHDHWLFMVCASTGKFSYMDKPLMKYRIHDTNAIGYFEKKGPFTGRFLLSMKDILKYCFSNKNYRDLLYTANIRQMQDICGKLGATVSTEAIAFSAVDSSNYFTRKLRNIFTPYRLEGSFLKQLTYIICF